MKPRQSFTLIELVIVIGILSVLAAVAVIVINPGEQMKAARDSQRVSELQTITKAIGLYLGDGKSGIGSTNVVYVSIPDSSATCANLGLPALPAGWSYQCSTSANYRKIDATGWLPINFSSISFGNTMEALPVDPINATSTGNYYTYTTGGSFELTASMEAAKYKLGGANDKASKDGGIYPELYETGSNLTLLPVNYGDTSLVGYWKFDEGFGTTAYDASGHGNNGTLYSIPTWAVSAQCKVNSCINIASDNPVYPPNTVRILDSPNLGGMSGLTVTVWLNLTATSTSSSQIIYKRMSGGVPAWYSFLLQISSAGLPVFRVSNAAGTIGAGWSDFPIQLSKWYQLVGVYDGSKVRLYINGSSAIASPPSLTGSVLDSDSLLAIGALDFNGNTTLGYIDDIRIYNRALSAAEISALYNATNK